MGCRGSQSTLGGGGEHETKPLLLPLLPRGCLYPSVFSSRPFTPNPAHGVSLRGLSTPLCKEQVSAQKSSLQCPLVAKHKHTRNTVRTFNYDKGTAAPAVSNRSTFRCDNQILPEYRRVFMWPKGEDKTHTKWVKEEKQTDALNLIPSQGTLPWRP